MRRTIFLLSLLLVFSLAPLARADEDVHSLMVKIQEKYGRLDAASASYTRDVITRSMSMMGMKTSGDLAKGKLFFQFPLSIRMEQETPHHETLLSDGAVLLWYVPDKKTLYKYPADKFGKELSVLRDLFRGLEKAEKRFHIDLMEPAEGNAFRLKLTPTPPWEQVDYLVVLLSRKVNIKGLEIHNILGSITRFTIEGLKAAGPFKKNFFKLQVPDDVKIVEEQ